MGDEIPRRASPPDSAHPGPVIATPARSVSAADIEQFAHLTGDENPLHLDEAFARQQLFGGRVAHGLLTLSITLGLWYQARAFDGRTVVFSGIDRLRFRRPVRPGDTLTAEITILRRETSERGEKVEVENATFNQRKEVVLSFTARLLLARA